MTDPDVVVRDASGFLLSNIRVFITNTTIARVIIIPYASFLGAKSVGILDMIYHKLDNLLELLR